MFLAGDRQPNINKKVDYLFVCVWKFCQPKLVIIATQKLKGIFQHSTCRKPGISLFELLLYTLFNLA
jgi:hypothetical protein